MSETKGEQAFDVESGPVTDRVVPGPALYAHTVLPKKEMSAIVGVIHGYADHGGRYLHVMERWATRGIGSIAIDLRGHGRSDGPRGYCSRFDEFLDDASELARKIDDRAKDAPKFLFGHSFGGLVAALFAIQKPAIEKPPQWRGIILSNPFFGLALKVPPIKVFAGKIASRIVPKLGIPSGLSGKDLTHDAARAKAYDEDPLGFPNATARWFTETERAQAQALARASELALPLYELFGMADPIADAKAGRAFFDHAGSPDKKWDGREGLYHETLNEPVWPSIADSIADWIALHQKE
jgi:alpha-beta hydrolase superfamily lysophospholipase